MSGQEEARWAALNQEPWRAMWASATDVGKCIQNRAAPGDAEGKEVSNE